MIKEKSLPSCIALFKATQVVADGAATAMEKHIQLKHWQTCVEDGGWLDGVLHFNIAGVELKTTPLEYQLMAWNLPDLAWAAPTIAQQGPILLPHLTKYHKIFDHLGAILPKYEGEYKSVAHCVNTWLQNFALDQSETFCCTPWHGVGGRDFSFTEKTIDDIKILREYWPLLGPADLPTVVKKVQNHLVLRRVCGKKTPTGALIMLMGCDEQTRLSEAYQQLIKSLPADSKAQLEKWLLLLTLDGAPSHRSEFHQKPRKM